MSRSEAHRAFTRIGTNYARLGVSLVLGLALVPLLLGRLGSEAFGLIGLLGSTIGLAAVMQEIVRGAMVRELGQAFHDSREAFLAAYNTAILLCLAIGAGSLLLFAIVWAVIPLLEVPPDLLAAARWLVVARGLETAASIALAPAQRMYLVTERMALANLWALGDRVSRILAAIWIVTLAAKLAVPEALVIYAWLGSGLMIAIMVAAAAMMAVLEPTTVPRPACATRSAARSLLTIGGYNAAGHLATNLHLPVGQILLNLFLGLRFNAVFAIAITLAGYTRMTAMGVTAGVDAVAARLSARAGSGAVTVLLRHSTRLHAVMALPVAAAVLTLAEPIMQVWLGSRLPGPGDLQMAANLSRLVVLGMTARALGDGWTRILYGAGHIQRYTPVIIGAGVASPPIAALALILLPEHLRYSGPAIAFATTLLVAYLGILPRITASALGVQQSVVLAPLVRPALVTAAILPILIGARIVIAHWGIVELAATGLVAAAAYGGLTWLIVVAPDERRRIGAAALRRIPFAQ